jgi:two-component system nitrogen regulation sensor histidine kinase NtrY
VSESGSEPRPRWALRDTSLYSKTALTLTGVFAAIAAGFLAVLVPGMEQQRAQLLTQERRLLSTLRDRYERDFVYDLLSQNVESLAVNLAAFAGETGVVWVRLQTPELDLAATGDASELERLLGAEAGALSARYSDPMTLIVDGDGYAELIGVGGRRLAEPRDLGEAPQPGWWEPDRSGFEESEWLGRPVLYQAEELGAPGDVFGRLHVVASLAHVQQIEAVTARLFYGFVGSSFVLLLVLLNLLLSRIVIAPVRSILDAMSEASTGDLNVRLPVHSRDEIGEIARSFNAMVGQLDASRREVEEYSRNLEGMVEARTRALRESEAKLMGVKNHLATVISTVATGVVSVDTEGRVTTFNERAAEILCGGTRPEEGQPLAEALEGEEARPVLEFVMQVATESSDVRHGQIALARAQGRRTLSVVGSPLIGEGSRRLGAVVVLDDLTEILAHQRLQAWKEAVERVIHEIKNPLTPVGLAAQTLRTAHADDRERFEQIFPSAIQMILGAVRDLKDLISEFTRFSRLPEAHLEPEQVNDMVREALAPYEQAQAGDVAVRLQLAPELPLVEADREQLKRVLLNVVNNGLEAMEGRAGELVVATRSQPGAVVISVADQGPGVEDAERIFEPHYTTKVKGTGLGLAIARQIVAEHGGEIDAERRAGGGTVVAIRLPVAVAATG